MRSFAQAASPRSAIALAHVKGAGFSAFLRASDGSGLIETAVCLPVLMTVVTGIFTFGIAMNNYLLLTDATNVGARQLAISRGQTTDPCKTASTAVIAATPILKSSNLTFNYVFNGTAYSGTTCSSSSPSTGRPGTWCRLPPPV